MILSDQSKLMSVLAELCGHYPDWRFGQLIANVADWADVDIWNVENDQLLAAAQKHLQDLAHREETVGTASSTKS